MKKPLVTINGKERDKISVFDHEFLYGDGVFDTFRIFNGAPFYMEKHIDRLFSSARNLNLQVPYSQRELIELVKKIYNKSELENAFIRIIITWGEGPQGLFVRAKPNLVIICDEREFSPLKKIRATVSEMRRHIDGLGFIKSLNYGLNAKALNQAKKRKFDEAIFLNEDGFLTEATTSNVFIVKNGKLSTPSLKSGCLPGITRELIIKKLPVAENELTLDDLFSADEVFLSGTVNFITCIRQIDKIRYNKFDLAGITFKKLIGIHQKSINP